MSNNKRIEVYQKNFGSNIFNIPSNADSTSCARESSSLGKKVSPLKNKDQFAQLAKPPSLIQIKTGKRLQTKKSTDIFNRKKKEIDPPRIKCNRKNISIVFQENNSKDYIVNKKPYKSDYDENKYLKFEPAHVRKMKDLYNVTAPPSARTRAVSERGNTEKIKVNVQRKKPIIHKTNHSFSSNSRVNKIKMLQSNIFNSASKEQLNNRSLSQQTSASSANRNNSYPKNPKSAKVQNHNKKISEYSGFTAKIDWKNTNTEILFKRKLGKNENNHKKETMKTLSESNNCTESKKKLKQFCNNYSSNESKSRKLADSYSSYQGGNFFMDNFIKNKNNDTLNCTEEKFEIKNIKSYQEKEIKQSFLENGIQIYDVSTSSNVLSNSNNSLQFKIRQNYNDKNYQNKLKQVSIALKKKTGNELRKVGVSGKGKKTLPSFENYDSTPIVSIRPMKISKVSNGGKNRHAFSKDYGNINYKYKSGCPLSGSRK